jgi:hypothetical protein
LQGIYALAQSYSGASSGWQLPASWLVPAIPPSAVSSSPNLGSGLSTVFSVTYTDPVSLSDLQVVYLEIGLSAGGAHSCFAAYVPASNALYLFNDTNSAVLGPVTPGSSASVANSQCTLSGNGGAVTSSGSNITVPFSVTFVSTFNGQKNLLGYAQSYSGATTGWQQLGYWTPSAGGTLTAISVSPFNGSGFGPQTFTASYTDSNGGSDIQVVYLDFGSSVLSANSCIVAYVLSNNSLYLFTNDNSGILGPISAGTASTVSNKQCTLSGSGGLASLSGNGAMVPFNITFANSFTATQTMFAMVQSYGGAQSPWATLGYWTP